MSETEFWPPGPAYIRRRWTLRHGGGTWFRPQAARLGGRALRQHGWALRRRWDSAFRMRGNSCAARGSGFQLRAVCFRRLGILVSGRWALCFGCGQRVCRGGHVVQPPAAGSAAGIWFRLQGTWFQHRTTRFGRPALPVSTAGHFVSAVGQRVSYAGQLVRSGGHRVSTTGNKSLRADHCVSTIGQRVSRSGIG